MEVWYKILEAVKSNLALSNFEVWQLAIFGLFVLTFLVQMYWWLRFFTGVPRYNRKFNKNQIKFDYSFPSVSVIICAKDEELNLKEFLPLVLKQNYPDYEVIIVNDASFDDTEQLLAEMKLKYGNLRSTYVPEKAKFIDSKKFAVTLGIKAAKNDILVFTDADCYPESEEWLNNIVRTFTEGTEIVLGYGAYRRKKSLLNAMQVFDTLFIAIQYLNYSLAGKTYMGVGRNMAYRKSMFLKSKGFTNHLNLQSGDDDLFINEVATKSNTRIEIQPESKTISDTKPTFKQWFQQKSRHLSTGSYYKSGTKALIGTEMASRALFYLSFIGALICGNIVTAIIVALCFVIRYLTQYIIINKTATQLGERRYWFGILFMDITLPLINLCLNMQPHRGKKGLYLWK